jgi:glycosyltransferase involved in cell wall biosynthesis
MRVAHITDVYLPQVGGIEIFVDDLARRQARAGHEVVVLTGSPGRAVGAESGIEVVRPARKILAARHLVDVRRRISSADFEVVHGHLSVVSPFTSLLGRHAARTGMPLVLTVHSIWDGRLPVVKTVGGIVGWRDWPARWAAVSAAVAADLGGALGSHADIAVVPNAVESEWWRRAAAQRWDASGRPTTFVSVLRMVERKRPLALVRALHQARKRVRSETPMRAILVGDGPLATIVADELRHRRMSDWVTMTGQLGREQIRDIYAGADVYVAPADRESFGIAALEARAAGLAVIAMRKGGVGDFVADGVEGTLCADDAELSRALATMAARPAVAATMKAHNSVVPPRISWEGTLAAYTRCYAEAASIQAVAVRRSPADASMAGSM